MRYVALDINAKIVSLKKARCVPNLDVTRSMFNDYGPLLELGRYTDARDLLLYCRKVYQKEKYIEGLGLVFGALADLEYAVDHIDQAVRFGKIALKYNYTTMEPLSIALSHYKMADFLHKIDFKFAVIQTLAAVIINHQMGIDKFASGSKSLIIDLIKFGPDALPTSFDQLCAKLEEFNGVHFRELFEQLNRTFVNGDDALQAAIFNMLAMAKQN